MKKIYAQDKKVLKEGELFSCRPLNILPVHSLGELFSCRPFNSMASYFRADHITVRPCNELFLCCLSFGRVIFVPTI